jgi:hypothetical protein
MPIALNEVVPWGRTMDEYQRMFALDETHFALSLLGCSDGPASFNAEWTARGGRVVSCDPIYNFAAHEIERRVRETYNVILQGVRENYEDFVWHDIASPEALGERRLTAMRGFLDDYETGKREGRYITAALPALPFADGQFDLALVSHFLFLYSQQLDWEFHRAAFHELCRVAREVRVFPLLALGNSPSPYVTPLIEEYRARGWHAEEVTVNYEFQKNGNQMLRVWRE